jgi:uncharacterized damage-inducible protein DinB
MELESSQRFYQQSTSALLEEHSSFRPAPDMMTAAQQVAHSAFTIHWFLDGAEKGGDFDLDFESHATILEDVQSLTAARTLLAAAYQRAVAFVTARSAEDLATPMAEGPIMGGQPVESVLWGIVEHSAHHRGALTVYARLLGRVPPMPYGD